MNLVSTSSIADLTPDRQPPLAPDGRLRLLNIGLPILGLSSFTRALHKFTAARDDVAAVHFELKNPTWMKLLARVSPRPNHPDLNVWRFAQLWRGQFRRWMRSGQLDMRRYDAVICCPQWFIWAFSSGQPRRYAVAIHTDATTKNTIDDFGDSPITTRRLLAAERDIFSGCDLITTMGHWALDSAVNDYAVPPAHGLWTPPTAENNLEPRTTGWADGPTKRLPRIVFVGNDWIRKGGQLLLGWHQARWKDRAELHFVGRDAIVDNTAKNVIWHGQQPRDKVMLEIVPSMDFFVMPTQREMSSWVGVEAMMASVPVILSHIGGIPSLVKEGETGFLCNPKDQASFIARVEFMLDNPRRCLEMGQAAYHHAKARFTPNVVYGELIDRLRAAAQDRQR